MTDKYKKMKQAAEEVLNEIEKSLENVDENRKKEFLKSLEGDILASNNVALFYLLTRVNSSVIPVDARVYRKAILDSKDPRYNYLIAGNDIFGDDSYEKAVLESKSPEYSYLFALNVRGANKKAHEKVVLESKDPQYNFLYMKNITKANERAHVKVIVESKDLEYNCLALENFYSYSAFFKHSNVILESKDPEYNCRAAVFMGNDRNVKNNKFVRKRREQHKKIVVESKDVKSNFELAKDFWNREVEESIRIIIESKDVEYNYRMAIEDKTHLLEYAQVIIDSKDVEYNYLFAKDVNGANIEAHREVILEAQQRSFIEDKEKEIIDKFLQEFPMNDYSDEMTNVKNFIKKYNFN